MVSYTVYKDGQATSTKYDELEQLFLDCIEELDSLKTLNSMGMHFIFSEFLSKVANIHINEFLH